MHSVTVAIVEDHKDLRNSLKLVLDQGIAIVCAAAYDRCEKLIAKIEKGECEPDIILMDIGLPGMNGIEGVKKIKAIHPEVKILMITVYEDDHHVFQAVCAGADGYLLKGTSCSEILSAIDQVQNGGVPMTPLIARKIITMFRNFSPVAPQKDIHLTPREMDVLRALVDGLGYKQIAARYHISIDTVRNHIRKIYSKLQVHSKSEAVAKALKQRLV